MSEIADTTTVLRAHENRLDKADARFAALEARVNDFEKNLLAKFDQHTKTTSGLMAILRDGVAEECRKLREAFRGRY